MRSRGLLASWADSALRKVGPTLAGSVDALGARALWYRSPAAQRRSSAESLGPAERLDALASIDALYGAPRLLEEPDLFFGAARTVEPLQRPVGPFRRDGGSAEVVDLSWASRVDPFIPDLAARCADVVENRTARARLYRGEGTSRPLAILVHGYRGGHFGFEERAWPVGALLRRGMDVTLFQLPHHGLRARPGAGPRFPGSDPRLANEGFGQAVRDLRDLLHWAKRSGGAGAVLAMGMSLGGYMTSLLATLEPSLSFAAPLVPLARLDEIEVDLGRILGSRAEQAEERALRRRIYRVVSPFARPSQVPPERVLVLAGAGDLITPLSQARALAEHFRCDLEVFHGAHIVHFGRKRALARLDRTLVLARRRP